MASRFQCLLQTLEVTPEKAVSITKACLTLHNLFRERYGMNNIGADEEDENNEVIPGQWRTDAVMHEVDAQLHVPRANAAGQALPPHSSITSTQMQVVFLSNYVFLA